MAYENVQYHEIFPSNRANAENSFSYRDGNPIASIRIPAMSGRVLLSETLRIHYKLRLQQSTGTVAVPVYPNNNDALHNGVPIEVRQNAKAGGHGSSWQSIQLSNNRNNSLERVNQLPRLVATLLSSGGNFSNYSNELGLSAGATASDDAQGRKQNQEIELCSKIMCGLFIMGDALPIGENYLNGIQINLNIASSVMSLYGNDAAGAFFQILNPSITFSTAVPVVPIPMTPFQYSSFSDYYNVISNGDSTVNIACGLSNVISQWSNYCPVSYIASVTNDGNETYPLLNAPYTSTATSYAPIKKLTTQKNSLNYPYAFSVEENKNITNTAGVYSANYTGQRERNFLSALLPSKDRTATLMGNLSENGLGVSAVPVADQNRYQTLGKTIFGTGSRYDGTGGGYGTSFKNASWSQRSENALDGVSPNAMFTYFFHRNLVSFSPSGISVTN